MKKILMIFLVFSFLVIPTKNSYAMSAKGKAFLIICTYGTVGGALLGFASMAFGTNSRAIAQGASLGLYAGIGFGSYVIASHGKQTEPDYPVDQAPPPGYGTDPYGAPGAFGAPPPAGGGYGAPADQGYGGGGYGAPAEQEPTGGFFGGGQRYLEISDELIMNYKLKNKKGRDFSPPVYIPLVNMQF